MISLRTVLLVFLLLIALGVLPFWPYSRSWGYYGYSGSGTLIIVLILILLLG